MTWQTFVLKLVELLRPRFYNRITWLVVFAGITMMSTHLWEVIVSELLKREFEISISGSNDVAWGFALCVLGLVYHMANTGFYELVKANEAKARKEREQQHDAAIFKQANEILSEEQVAGFIYTIKADHSYTMDASGQIDNFVRFLAATNNQFLTAKLKAKTDELLTAWENLGTFISFKFYIFPKNQNKAPYRLCMAPALNMDREGSGMPEQVSKYDELTSELEDLSEKFEACYHKLRAEIKNELVI